MLDRFSLLVFVRPRRYLDDEFPWETLDIEAWSVETYRWTQDPWNGWLDFVQSPARTLDVARGDCDDYALVAASWAVATDRDGIGLALCGTGPRIHHMLAYDDERTYSSGEIRREGPGEYLDRTDYTWIYTRPV